MLRSDQTAPPPITIPSTFLLLDRLSLVAQWGKQLLLFFFIYLFLLLPQSNPERCTEPLFFQQQLESTRTSAGDTMRANGGRCSSRRKLPSVPFREGKQKKELIIGNRPLSLYRLPNTSCFLHWNHLEAARGCVYISTAFGSVEPSEVTAKNVELTHNVRRSSRGAERKTSNTGPKVQTPHSQLQIS